METLQKKMQILNKVSTLDQRALDHIQAVLLNAYYKGNNNRYPTNVEGIVIVYDDDYNSTELISATLYAGAGEGITRRFNERKLMDKSTKLPKYF